MRNIALILGIVLLAAALILAVLPGRQAQQAVLERINHPEGEAGFQFPTGVKGYLIIAPQSLLSLNGVGESNENISDVLDRAAKIAESNFSHRLCSREKLLIRKIERSLQDIENGDYGYCQHCEESISVKRLKARPTAQYCIDCKTQMETMERLTGT